MKKPQHLKSRLRVWNKEVFGNIEEAKNKLSLELEVFDGIEEERELNQEEGDERKRIKFQFEKLLRDEEIKWRQKAKFRWFKEVDGNSKFFHRMANTRRMKNQIN